VEIMPGAPKGTPAAFLPARYAGTAVGRTDPKSPHRSWDNLLSAKAKRDRRRLDLVQAMNAERLGRSARRPTRRSRRRSRTWSSPSACRPRRPDLLTLKGETDATRAMYGIGEDKTDDFGRACLLARRFAERGVRYVTLMHSTREFGNLWDQHKDLYDGPPQQRRGRRPADRRLLRDLKSAGHARRHAGDVRQRVRAHARCSSSRTATTAACATAATTTRTGSRCGSPARA
jgi:hypothetical protein